MIREKANADLKSYQFAGEGEVLLFLFGEEPPAEAR